MRKHLLAFLMLAGALLLLQSCGGSGAKGGGTQQIVMHLSIAAPATAASGTSFAFPISVQDASNNMVANYSGTVHFTSTDAQAVLPPDTPIAYGFGSFSATMTNLGPQQISATVTGASITGTSESIDVLAAGTFVITSGQPPDGTVGVPYGGVQPICVMGMVEGFELEAFGGAAAAHADRGGSGAGWSSSALPPGLELYADVLGGPPNCPTGTIEVIDGIPTEAGTFTFTLTASDSVDTASATYTIKIANAAR